MNRCLFTYIRINLIHYNLSNATNIMIENTFYIFIFGTYEYILQIVKTLYFNLQCWTKQCILKIN